MSSFHTFFGSACLVKKSREIEKKVSFHAVHTKPVTVVWQYIGFEVSRSEVQNLLH